MKRFLSLPRLIALFGFVLALAIGGVLIFQFVWLDPGERCERNGMWYDVETRICAKPIYIPNITGRPEGVTRAEASEAANRERARLDSEAATEKRAVEAEIARQREALSR